ncbi:MAG: site-2 protease family protein [Akkermansiaceae bacterium]|nr:site-2 protease family protein [Akkermansiaceae bacterium]NNM28148.1 site-2 protease family protein [Akkermansiaceae bacterium]
MRWSIRLGSVAGTEVRVHVTFFLLLAAVGWLFFARGGADAAVDGVLFILAVFGCVLLHEFGHVLTARQFGVRTPDITLLPIGGMARMQKLPDKPWQELLVAIAGPAVNVVIGAVLLAIFGARAVLEGGEEPQALLMNIPFGERLMVVNFVLVIFNMIPAFPMDGGRVLRALLAMMMNYGTATKIASVIGQGLALAGGFLGLLGPNPILILIAVFVFMAARGESEMVQMRIALQGVPLERAMMTDFRVLPAEATLADAAALLLAGAQHDFPVLADDGRLLGLLTRRQLIEGLSRNGAAHPAAEAMLRDVPTVPVGFPLREAFQVLNSKPVESLPVMDNTGSRVVGMLTAENVGELILIREAEAG